jgi:TonB family protein
MPQSAAAAEAAPPEQQKEQAAAAPMIEAELPDVSSLQDPAKEKQSKTEPAAKTKRAPPARLDVSPPMRMPDMPRAAAGRSAAFSRPPGVTRSGENDEFGRGVIRALRTTMPPPAGIFGRVAVRLFLNENGDLAEVRVIETSGKSALDQSVVFAIKQTNFPLPPHGASVADRTFLIGYVYR